MTNRMIDWITSRPVGWLIDSLTWRFNQWSVESFVYCTCVAVFVFVLNNLGPKSLCVPCFGIIFLHQSLFQVLGHTILMCIAQVLSAVPQPSQCQGHPERLESLKTVPFEERMSEWFRGHYWINSTFPLQGTLLFHHQDIVHLAFSKLKAWLLI